MTVTPDTNTSLLLQSLEQMSGLERQLGVLQGQSNLIIGEQQRAADGRKETHERLRKLEASALTIDRIAPMVEAHEKTYQRGLGAAWLWRALWGVLVGAAGAAAALLAKALGGH